MTEEEQQEPERRAAARGRAVFYSIGGVLAGGAILLDLVPGLASMASPLGIRVCALAGAGFLAMGRFGSSRFRARFGKGWGAR